MHPLDSVPDRAREKESLMGHRDEDALVIADALGQYYVLPLTMIREAKVTDEERELIDEQLGVDTVGFASLGHGFSLVGPLVRSEPAEA